MNFILKIFNLHFILKLILRLQSYNICLFESNYEHFGLFTKNLYFQIFSYSNHNFIVSTNKMFKILSLACLLGISCSSFISDKPDAIRCGGNKDNFFYAQRFDNDGNLRYCNSEGQCLRFSPTGDWLTPVNINGDRKVNCQNKSLATLKDQGRTYQLAKVENQDLSEDTELNNYLSSKFDMFQQALLNKIKGQGLEIGTWKIKQQGQDFAIQETILGYRIAFAPPAPAVAIPLD